MLPVFRANHDAVRQSSSGSRPRLLALGCYDGWQAVCRWTAAFPTPRVLFMMAARQLLLLLLAVASSWCCSHLVPAAESPGGKPRLLVLTDIGGDPDDQQSLIRLML